MNDDVGGKLDTLRELNRGLDSSSTDATNIKSDIEKAVNQAVWRGPNAEKFRSAWEEFKPTFDKLQTALNDGAKDIKIQHNNLAEATGSPERI